MALHNELGRKGERLAEEYLLRLGYTIMFRNWRHSKYEIDVVAEKDGVLHFIEVKTRGTGNFGLPEESVNKHKLRSMIGAGERFLELHPRFKRIQFDVLAISIVDEEVRYFLIEDVYL